MLEWTIVANPGFDLLYVLLTAASLSLQSFSHRLVNQALNGGQDFGCRV
jgi:hypothetical protein